MSRNIFLKQYLFCIAIAIVSTLSIYNLDKSSTTLFYVFVLLFYMPSPLYATIIFEKGFIKSQIFQIKTTPLKKIIRISITTISIFWLLIFLNYILFYVLETVLPKNIIGFVSFDNENIYKNLLNLISSEISLPQPQFKNSNGVPLFLILLLVSTFAGCFFNSIFAFTEEVGWRGSFLKNINIKSNILKHTIIGTLWGVWHSPLILAFGYNYPHLKPIYGMLMMIGFCLSLHFLLITINDNTVIKSSVLHGCINASPVLYILFHTNYNDAFSLVCGVIPTTSIFIIYLFIKSLNRWKILK